MADLPIRHEDLYHGIAVPSGDLVPSLLFPHAQRTCSRVVPDCIARRRGPRRFRLSGRAARMRRAGSALLHSGPGIRAGGRPHIPRARRATRVDRRPSSARALADPSAPWELLWARVDGHTLHGIVKVLQIHESRIFDLPDAERVRKNLLRSIYYYKSWRVPDLARIAGMSVPQ